MDENFSKQFEDKFRAELENAFSRGIAAGGQIVAKTVLSKMNEYKHNPVVSNQKARMFCNYVIEFAKVQEKENEQKESLFCCASDQFLLC